VTATGAKAELGFDWKKPKPLASSPGMRFRSETSFTSRISWIACLACATDAPIGTSPVTTAISASKSMPQASSPRIGSQGARNESEPP